MNILIIEDEILIQRSLKLLLEKKKHFVDTASSGREALNLIPHKSYDRIVCDLMLQDITGFDVIEGSKKYYGPEEIKKKFVIITAYSSESALQKANNYGCPIIKKPFADIQQALEAITELPNE